MAMLKILEKAAELILEQNGIRVSVARIENRVRAKHENIQVGTREVPLAPILKVAAKAYAPDVVNQVKGILPSGRRRHWADLARRGRCRVCIETPCAPRCRPPRTYCECGESGDGVATGFCYFGMSL